jgi:hypothetical protein
VKDISVNGILVSVNYINRKEEKKKKQIRKNEECRLFSKEEYENEVCTVIY